MIKLFCKNSQKLLAVDCLLSKESSIMAIWQGTKYAYEIQVSLVKAITKRI